LLRGHRGEVGQVLLDLTLGANVAQQLHDSAASGGQVRVSCAGVVANLASGRSLDTSDASSERRGSRCGEGTEGLSRSSPHSGAKGHHLAQPTCGSLNGLTVGPRVRPQI
jgi:hypothetical protein